MPDWYKELKTLFKEQIGASKMVGTAYDTAWVASIPNPERPDHPAFPQALEWLRLHQHSDGSWGAEVPYAHDKIISTLAAVITLAKWTQDEWIRIQIDNGLRSIWRNLIGLTRDPYETIGFELVLPTLLELCRKLAFDLPYDQFEDYATQREQKLALLPPHLIYSRQVSSAFSIEFLGDRFDAKAALSNGGLQEGNGSIASSPSASAFYLTKMQKDNAAFDYLHATQELGRGSVPAVAPLEIFERAWALYNLEKTGYDLAHSEPDIALHLEELYKAWTSRGVSHTRYFSVPELDDTAVTFRALQLAGYAVSIDVFAEYEVKDHFRCFPFERNTSISAHVHLLEALQAAGCDVKHPFVQKALQFLERNRTQKTYWFDKWHVSPYYTTTHAVLAIQAFGNDDTRHIVDQAVRWIERTQNADGSWGVYGFGTAEETAYCLQALLLHRKMGGSVDPSITSLATKFLLESKEHHYCSYTPLWIGKSLYCPTNVVRTSVLSALALADEASLVGLAHKR